MGAGHGGESRETEGGGQRKTGGRGGWGTGGTIRSHEGWERRNKRLVKGRGVEVESIWEIKKRRKYRRGGGSVGGKGKGGGGESRRGWKRE